MSLKKNIVACTEETAFAGDLGSLARNNIFNYPEGFSIGCSPYCIKEKSIQGNALLCKIVEVVAFCTKCLEILYHVYNNLSGHFQCLIKVIGYCVFSDRTMMFSVI